MQEQKRPSVKDIASKLHISLSTVHKALTGKSGISEVRRRQVLEMAEEMGYVVNTVAQSLSRRSMNIGVILPSKWQEYFQQLKMGIDSQLDAMQEYRVNGVYYTFSGLEQEQEAIDQWIQHEKIDAVLYCASNYAMNEIAKRALGSTVCPVFWVGGSQNADIGISSVTIDAVLIGKLAADFLCCTATSPVKAVVFTGSMRTDIHRTKADAFYQRVLENGGQVLGIYETEDDPEQAYHMVCDLFAKHTDVNAVYVSTSTSEPICRYLEENELADCVSLLGTDIFPVLKEYINKGVMKATINQNQEEVGRIAAKTAYEYLHRTASYGNLDWKPDRQLLIKPDLLLKANIE